MPTIEKDERDLLDVLRAELDFFEMGGYGRSPREPWLRPMIFQDSPACMNYNSKQNPAPCDECVLTALVPPEQRNAKIPCYQIPLNAAGETLESLYRYAEDREIEEAYGKWLREMISRLEQLTNGPALAVAIGPDPPPVEGVALHQTLHPKCANPACPAQFQWRAGGKFFRFRDTNSSNGAKIPNTPSERVHSYGVKHYWLCDVCSRVYTLAYCDERGVVVKHRQVALFAKETGKHSSAA